MISLKHFVISAAIMFALVLYFQGNTTLLGEFGQNLELAIGALSNNDQNSTAENTTGVSNNFHEKGNALLDAGKYENAISYYDKILTLNSSDLSALNNKGTALNYMGKNQDALTQYDKALAIDPNNIDALYNKSFTLEF